MLFTFFQTDLSQPPLTSQMNTPMWIGFGLLALLVIFLIVSFFVTPRLTNDQRRTIKFLTALCAGAAGGFLTGGSILKFSTTTPTTTFSISAVGGVALFLLVFGVYNKVFSLGTGAGDENGLNIDIPAGWTFQQVADMVASTDKAGTVYMGFTTAEKSTLMRNQAVTGETQLDVLRSLSGLTQSGTIRPYTVEKQGGNYVLQIK